MSNLKLSKIPLFKNLPESEIDKLAGNLDPVEVNEPTVLFREGDIGDHFYIIQEGEVEVVKALGSADERVIAQRSLGDFVGEMSLVNRLRFLYSNLARRWTWTFCVLPRGNSKRSWPAGG